MPTFEKLDCSELETEVFADEAINEAGFTVENKGFVKAARPQRPQANGDPARCPKTNADGVLCTRNFADGVVRCILGHWTLPIWH